MRTTTILGLLAISISTLAIDTDSNPALNDALLLAPTMLDRWRLLSSIPGSWKYDFATNPQYAYRMSPGSVCNANKATWPALQGMGATVAQLNLGPCSMLPPHLHRCTNVVVSVQGTTHTMMVQENGAGVVWEDLGPGQLTLFPRASLHAMVNNGCTPNQLYSFLNCEDPGTLNVMNNMMQFGPDVGSVIMPWMANCNATQDWNATSSQVPPIGSGSNAWTQECLSRCKMLAPGNATRREIVY